MYFLIDFDRAEVDCKHSKKQVLSQYIEDNCLDIAVALVGSSNDIDDCFTVDEQAEVFENIMLEPPTDTDNLSTLLWREIIAEENNYPLFTKALGKRLIKTSKSETPKKKKPTKLTRNPGEFRLKQLVNESFTITDKPVKPNTANGVLVQAVEDNLGECTFDQLLEYFIDHYTPKRTATIDEKKAANYIRNAVNDGILEVI